MDNFFNTLVSIHCDTQQMLYDAELKTNENGYKPKTDVFKLLSIEETKGPNHIVNIVAAILAGAKFDGLVDPVATLSDLMMALKYKTKFFDPKEAPNNKAVYIINQIYNNSLDVVHEALYNGDVPADVADKVSDLIICE